MLPVRSRLRASLANGARDTLRVKSHPLCLRPLAAARRLQPLSTRASLLASSPYTRPSIALSARSQLAWPRSLTAIAAGPANEPIDPKECPLTPPEGVLAPHEKLGYLYFDTVFPITLGLWDLRRLAISVESKTLLEKLRATLPQSQEVGYGFEVLGVEARNKDGGAFVSFRYSPGEEEEKAVLDSIELHLKRNIKQMYAPGMLLVAGWAQQPSVHVVRGTPWREDLARFPARQVKINFEGGDGKTPDEQTLWETLRPFGKILNLSIDKKEAVATVTFSRMRGATSARNCAHGVKLVGGTRMIINYQPAYRYRKIWDWLTNHPRIVFPFVALFLGSLTYAIFDPIRAFCVERKLDGSFRLEEYRLYNWVKANTVALFDQKAKKAKQDDWWERDAAVKDIRGWLRETPSTFITISGPRGSGKHQLLRGALTREIQHLRIDCGDIARAGKTDSGLASALASEIGYFPLFSFLGSVNQLIDLAAVGLIGSKAGFSTPIDAQLRQILSTATDALISANAKMAKKKAGEKKRKGNAVAAAQRENGGTKPSAPGLPGVVSDEAKLIEEIGDREEVSGRTGVKSEAGDGEYDAPVLVFDGFCHKGLKNDLLWTVMAEWAAELATNRIAHVVFVSDNPVQQAKTLSRALPNVPFQSIVLADADRDRARGYVANKLQELGSVEPAVQTDGAMPGPSSGAEMAKLLSPQTARTVDVLGGRLTDLEQLVEKLSLGQTVESAVEDIVSRTVIELRKNAFGDDMEDAKALPWTREQAWIVVEALATKQEAAYYSILHEHFKSDEAAIKALEQAEIISVRHVESRPSTIRAGRPVLQEAMKRLVDDDVFACTQKLLSAAAGIESAEKSIKAIESELRELGEFAHASGASLRSDEGVRSRAEFLLHKLSIHQDKVGKLDELSSQLKKHLAEARDRS